MDEQTLKVLIGSGVLIPGVSLLLTSLRFTRSADLVRGIVTHTDEWRNGTEYHYRPSVQFQVGDQTLSRRPPFSTESERFLEGNWVFVYVRKGRRLKARLEYEVRMVRSLGWFLAVLGLLLTVFRDSISFR